MDEKGRYDYPVVGDVYNYDGDTITVYLDTGVRVQAPGQKPWIDLGLGLYVIQGVLCSRETVRLANVDTPEMRGGTRPTRELAEKAKTGVRNWFSNNKGIKLHSTERGKYGRLVGDFSCESSAMLSEFLLSHRLAIPYTADRTLALSKHEENAEHHGFGGN